MHCCETLFAQKRLIPLIVIDDPGLALPLAETLLEAGLPLAEVAFRTEGSEEALRRMASCPGMCAGAGTITTLAAAKKARDAGARFIVTPGFCREVTEYCLLNALPVFPGVATPTEVMQAFRCGLTALKLFPAEALGGVAYLKALSGPFPAARFIPTGGIGLNNLSAYLALPQVLAVGGSFMAERALIDTGDFSEIARRTKTALELVNV